MSRAHPLRQNGAGQVPLSGVRPECPSCFFQPQPEGSEFLRAVSQGLRVPIRARNTGRFPLSGTGPKLLPSCALSIVKDKAAHVLCWKLPLQTQRTGTRAARERGPPTLDACAVRCPLCQAGPCPFTRRTSDLAAQRLRRRACAAAALLHPDCVPAGTLAPVSKHYTPARLRGCAPPPDTAVSGVCIPQSLGQHPQRGSQYVNID